MSLRQRKQQDCQQYLTNWNNYKSQLGKQEKILLLESKELIDKFKNQIESLENKFKIEKSNIDKEVLSKCLQEQVNQKNTIIRNNNIIIKKLKDRNKNIKWPYFVTVVIAGIILFIFAKHLGY
jgi:sugar-specific transcriptional regulator TrmB